MKMKRILALVMIICLILAATACQGADTKVHELKVSFAARSSRPRRSRQRWTGFRKPAKDGLNSYTTMLGRSLLCRRWWMI